METVNPTASETIPPFPFEPGPETLQGRCTAIAPATPYAVTHNPRTHRLWVQMDLGSANLKPNPSDSSVEISGLVGMIHGNLHADSYEY